MRKTGADQDSAQAEEGSAAVPELPGEVGVVGLAGAVGGLVLLVVPAGLPVSARGALSEPGQGFGALAGGGEDQPPDGVWYMKRNQLVVSLAKFVATLPGWNAAAEIPWSW